MRRTLSQQQQREQEELQLALAVSASEAEAVAAALDEPITLEDAQVPLHTQLARGAMLCWRFVPATTPSLTLTTCAALQAIAAAQEELDAMSAAPVFSRRGRTASMPAHHVQQLQAIVAASAAEGPAEKEVQHAEGLRTRYVPLTTTQKADIDATEHKTRLRRTVSAAPAGVQDCLVPAAPVSVAKGACCLDWILSPSISLSPASNPFHGCE